MGLHHICQQKSYVFEVGYIGSRLYIIDEIRLSEDGAVESFLEFVQKDLLDGFLSMDLLFLGDISFDDGLDLFFPCFIQDDLYLLFLVDDTGELIMFGNPKDGLSSVEIVDTFPILEYLLEKIGRIDASFFPDDGKKILHEIALHGLEIIQRESFVHG